MWADGEAIRAGRTSAQLEEDLLAAIDGEHVRDWTTPLNDRSEVVFMSKFSGG